MSTDNAGSASTQESSGQSENQSNDKVSYDTYRKVLNEAKKYRDAFKQVEEEKQRMSDQKLKEQNEWKTLADQYKSKLDETSKVLQEQEASIVNGMKYQEFEKHLGGKLKDQDYATFVPFDKIAINPETKRIDEESVKGAVADFVKKHSHLVEFTSGARLPNEAAKSAHVGSKSLSDMSSSDIMNELRKIGKLT